MKTAVIYSGQARTFGETFPNQFDKVLRLLPNPEFFVSVAEDPQAQTMTRLWERFPKESVHIEHVHQPAIKEPDPEPKWLQMYPCSTTRQGVLRQLWSLNRGWDFYRAHCGNEPKHELIVRLRPDLLFMRFELPSQVVGCTTGQIYTPKSDLCETPWWSRWGGVNDRIALLGSLAAREYFTTFTKIERLMKDGCPLHPETIVDRSIRDGHVVPSHTLATEFVAARLDGTFTPFDPSTIDIVEYARCSR